MIEIVEVKTDKQKKQFVDFPTKLYASNPYYVPPLRMDELALFEPSKNVSFDECEIVFYLAMKDGQVAGRICGIVQKVYNEKTHSKRVRFTRFDCIEDIEVAKALLNAVETWAKDKGMTIVHGPLGFNDLDREGLLVEGFDKLATFEENYNYPYYKDFLEKLGYEKEIDYLSFRIKLPQEVDPRIKRIGDMAMKKYNLHIATAKNKKEYLEKYKDGIFDLLDETYGDLYGVIPYNDKLKKQIIDQFNLIINLKFLITILDSNDRVIAFGFALPSLANAVRKSKGKILPLGLFRILHAKNHSSLADFGLVGVRKDYQGKGITAIILDYIIRGAKEVGVTEIETNHSLEDNHKILQTWKNFDDVTQHKRFRCFLKDLSPKTDKTETKKTTKSKTTKSKTTKSKSGTTKKSTKTSTKKSESKKTTKKSTTKKSTKATKKTTKKSSTQKAMSSNRLKSNFRRDL